MESETDEFMDCMDHMEEMESAKKNDETRPIVSLHAMLGTAGYQTMRLQGKIRNQVVIFLVDTGSTYNFVNGNVLKRIGGNLQTIDSFTVTVANGE